MIPVHPRLPNLIAAAALCAAQACTQVPALDETVTDDLRQAAYPALVPLGTALPPLPAPQDEAARLESALNGRRDNLKSRTGALQSQIIDEKTRKRMDEGVNR